MTLLKQAILQAVNLLIVVALTGLVVRGKLRRSILFATYLSAVLFASAMIGLWPSRFYSWDFWVVKEAVLTLLKFGIALELAARIFRVLPGALATTKVVFLLVLGLTAAAALMAPVPATHAGDIARQLMPRIIYGTAWLFAGLLTVVLWYQIPLDRLHKAMLTGFVPYLVVFTVAVDLLDVLGWDVSSAMGYANNVAYLLLVAFWALVIWTPEEPLTGRPEDLRVAHRLQPWR